MKPQNILLDKLRTCAKLTDFGVSRRVETTQSVTAAANIGTPVYSAPEVFHPVDRSITALTKRDVYSYAVTFWEVMCGEQPFPGCTVFELVHKVGNGERPDVKRLHEEQLRVPQNVRKAIPRSWAQDYKERPSMQEILNILDPSSNSDESPLSQEMECVICMNEMKSRVMIPCGHVCICASCDKKQNLESCPLCRKPIKSIHAIVLPNTN